MRSARGAYWGRRQRIGVASLVSLWAWASAAGAQEAPPPCPTCSQPAPAVSEEPTPSAEPAVSEEPTPSTEPAVPAESMPSAEPAARDEPPRPSELDAALLQVLDTRCREGLSRLRAQAALGNAEERALLKRVERACTKLSERTAATPAPQLDRKGRSTLVLGSTTYGLWVGLAMIGLTKPDDARVGVLLPLTGVGAGLAGSLLATKEGPISKGQAWTIITGFDYGTYLGLLLSLGLGFDDTQEVLGMMLTTGALSSVSAGVAAYSLDPSRGDAEVLRSGGLWGTATAALIALAVQPNQEENIGWTLLGGMAGGLAVGGVLAGEYAVSHSRMLLGDAGALAGAMLGAGAYILALGTPDSDADARALAITSAVGLHTGLITSLWLTRDFDPEDDDEDARVPAPGLLSLQSGRLRPGQLSLVPSFVETMRGPRLVGATVPLFAGSF